MSHKCIAQNILSFYWMSFADLLPLCDVVGSLCLLKMSGNVYFVCDVICDISKWQWHILQEKHSVLTSP